MITRGLAWIILMFQAFLFRRGCQALRNRGHLGRRLLVFTRLPHLLLTRYSLLPAFLFLIIVWVEDLPFKFVHNAPGTSAGKELDSGLVNVSV